MSDWNPAEIIGMKPSPLSVSLYEYIIGDYAWHKVRSLDNYKLLKALCLSCFVNIIC